MYWCVVDEPGGAFGYRWSTGGAGDACVMRKQRLVMQEVDVSWYLVDLRCGLQLQFVNEDNDAQKKKIMCYWCRDGDDALIKKTNGARERLGQVTAYIITKYFQV